MIQLEVLNAIEGGAKIYVEEENTEERSSLAKTVSKMIRDGHAVYLLDRKNPSTAVRIHSYNPERNEWIIQPLIETETKSKKRQKEKRRRISAQNSEAVAIAPAAGG